MDIQLARDFVHYDPLSGVMTWKKSLSNRAKAGSPCGSNIDAKGYGRVCFNGRQYRAHRFAWALYYGSEPNGLIDHINGNRLDNRICNLRIVDHYNNARNASIPKTNTSGVKGVTWHKSAKKWLAQITVNKKNKYLGLFSDFDLACKARQSAEVENFGKYSRDFR